MASSMTRNRTRLRDRFIARLLQLEPRSVLDVGCGGGELLAACEAAGISAHGIEPGDRLPAGFATVRGRAAALPIADGGVDWAVLRHVAHHLAEPERALAELWRVAESGVLVAEPWYDPEIPSQRLGAELDRWLKDRDRQRGEVHRDLLPAAELTAALPSDRTTRTTVECYLELSPWERQDVEHEVRQATGGREPTAEEQIGLQRFLQAAERFELTLPGTVVVTAFKR